MLETTLSGFLKLKREGFWMSAFILENKVMNYLPEPIWLLEFMWLREGKFKWVTKWLGDMEIKEL